MEAFTPRSPVEPPFGCSATTGLRPVGETVDRIVSRLAAVSDSDGRQPRYYAAGRMVVTAHSGRRASPPQAREAAHLELEGVIATRQDDLVEADLLRLGDLVRAIREAERNDPLPPATIMRAA